LIDKWIDYAEAHVQKYWIVNSITETTTVLRLQGDAFEDAGIYRVATLVPRGCATGTTSWHLPKTPTEPGPGAIAPWWPVLPSEPPGNKLPVKLSHYADPTTPVFDVHAGKGVCQ
jgi:hypothetical protein